jgi:hypothetical protein
VIDINTIRVDRKRVTNAASTAQPTEAAARLCPHLELAAYQLHSHKYTDDFNAHALVQAVGMYSLVQLDSRVATLSTASMRANIKPRQLPMFYLALCSP